jgi:hypothetical protein
MAIMEARPYQGQYRIEDEDDTQSGELTNLDSDTSTTDPDDNLSVEEKTWKKRYSDLKSYNDKKFNDLTKQVQSLQTQLLSANKEKMPSTPEEIDHFFRTYPDIGRHFRTIAMQEVLKQKQEIEQETQLTKNQLEELRREKAEETIRKAHKDYDDLRESEDFHEWAQRQSRTVQNMVYESDDPHDCITALDLYKSQLKKRPGPKPRDDAATLVNTRAPVAMSDMDGKKVWKTSEIRALKGAMFEKYEAEIEAAKREGRIVNG